MSDGLLPHTVSTRKAVTREARYEGTLGAEQLPLLRDVLNPLEAAPVSAQIAFYRDDEERQIVAVALTARVQLECQRCLESFRTTLTSNSELAIVRDDEEARQVPSRYEPLITLEETDLWKVVEEELALVLPVVAYHPDGECSAAPVPEAPEGSKEPGAGAEERPNPFAVLSSLLEEPRDEEERD